MATLNTRPILHHDILVHMMALLPHGDLFSLMRTSWDLYGSGIPFHVERKTSSMNGESLSSFFDFLLADPARLRHFKNLELHSIQYRLIRSTNGKNEHLEKLGQFLNHAALHLQTLDLIDAEYFFSKEWGESIGRAVSSLPNLKRLSLTGVSSLGGNVLKALQSPVSSLSVSFRPAPDTGISSRVDIVDFIANFKETLTVLEVTNALFQKQDVQFTKVHSITIGGSYINHLTLPYNCLPNLRNLYFIGDAHNVLFGQQIENTRAQNLLGLKDTHTSLDMLECQVNSAYLIGLRLQKPIQAWHIFSLSTSPQGIRRFHATLEDIQPIRLSTGRILGLERGDTIDTLESLFPQSPITHLSFSMNFSYLPASVEPAAVTDVYLLWASKLKLEFLQVHIRYNEQGWGENQTRVTGSPPKYSSPTPVGTYIEAWDLETYVRRLVEVSPTLQYAFFVFTSPKARRPPSFWQIVREEPNIQLRSLDIEEARMVTKKANFDVWIPPQDHSSRG